MSEIWAFCSVCRRWFYCPSSPVAPEATRLAPRCPACGTYSVGIEQQSRADRER